MLLQPQERTERTDQQTQHGGCLRRGDPQPFLVGPLRAHQFRGADHDPRESGPSSGVGSQHNPKFVLRLEQDFRQGHPDRSLGRPVVVRYVDLTGFGQTFAVEFDAPGIPDARDDGRPGPGGGIRRARERQAQLKHPRKPAVGKIPVQRQGLGAQRFVAVRRQHSDLRTFDHDWRGLCPGTGQQQPQSQPNPEPIPLAASARRAPRVAHRGYSVRPWGSIRPIRPAW